MTSSLKDCQTDSHHDGHPQSSLRRQSQVGLIEMEGLPKVFSVSLGSLRLHLLPLGGSQAMIEGLVGVVVDLRFRPPRCKGGGPSLVRHDRRLLSEQARKLFWNCRGSCCSWERLGRKAAGAGRAAGRKKVHRRAAETTFCCWVRLSSSWHNISNFHFFPRDSIRVRISNSTTPSLESQPGWSTDDL